MSENTTREHYQDPDRCAKCGGKCCAIYLPIEDEGGMPQTVWFEEWVQQWDFEFEESGANEIEPFFDPLVVYLAGNEYMLVELKKKGIDPCKCKYCSKKGCILPWDKRPNACKEYRCYEWRQEDE